MNARISALLLAGALAACSSGGTSSTVPGKTKVTPTGRATGTLTIRYPTAHKLKVKSKSSRRSPKFVDPYGETLTFYDAPPNAQPSDPSASTSITVSPSPDGTQTANVSLIAGDSFLTVNEYDDSSPGNLLATGTAFLAATPAGSTPVLTVTLNMVAVGTAIVSDINNQNDDVTALSNDPANPTDWVDLTGCTRANGTSYLLPYDYTDSYELFGQNVGVGGIPAVRIVSQVSANGGTSKVVTDIAGGIHPIYDAQFDAITVTLSVFDANGNVEATSYLLYNDTSCVD